MSRVKYWEVFKLGLKEASAYRTMAFASFASTVLYIVLLVSVWTAISRAGTLEGGLTRVISYVVLAQVINSSISTGIEKWFGERVRRGTITNELKRPFSVLLQAFLYDIGWRSLDTLIKSLPLLVLGIFFAGISLPSVYNFVSFGVSWFLSFVLMTVIALMTSMFVFWTKTDSGIRFTRSMLISFLSGVVFPLYLLPEELKSLFYALPFHLMIDGPINIFLGQRSAEEAIMIIGQQFLWIGIFSVLTLLLWSKAKTKLTVQGG